MKVFGIELQKGQVWNCDLSRFMIDHQQRPAMIYRILSNDFIEVATIYSSEKIINGRVIVREKRKFDLDIIKWKEYGFKNKSRIECDMIVKIKPEELLKYLFYTDKNLPNRVKALYRKSIKVQFSNPWNFVNWCKRNNIIDTIQDGVYNKNVIQNLASVIKTNRMNYLDAALIIRSICNKNRYKNYLLLFIIDSSICYLLSMFKNNKNKYFYFYWMGKTRSCSVSEGFKTEEELVDELCETKIFSNNIEYSLLNKDCIDYIDNDIEYNKTTFKEFFDKIESLLNNENNKVNESYSFFSNIEFK